MFEQGLCGIDQIPGVGSWMPNNLNMIWQELWRTVISGWLLSMNKEPDNDWCLYANTRSILHTFPCFSLLPPRRMASAWQAGSYYFIFWCSCPIMTPVDLWQEVYPASKQTWQQEPSLSQGSHSLGRSLSYWWSKEHQKIICDVTAIKHNETHSPRPWQLPCVWVSEQKNHEGEKAK